MTQPTPSEIEEKSRRAQQLLKDPVLREAVDALGRSYFEAWKIEQDPQKREQLWHRFGALEETLGALQTIADEWRLSPSLKNLRQKPK